MRCSRLTFLFFLLAIPATSFSWLAKVVSITDGDTIIVLHEGQKKEIGLYGIDSLDKKNVNHLLKSEIKLIQYHQ